MKILINSLVVFFVLLTFPGNIRSSFSIDNPTDGFTIIPLNQTSFKLQKPYNMPLPDRYSLKDGVRRFWVYADDKPFQPGSDTKPRTELRLQGLDYTTGIRQFEGYCYVPSGTSGVTIMQIFGGEESATKMQLRIYNGDMRYYGFDTVATDMYDKWFRLNVIHDVEERKITVFLDGVQKFVTKDRGHQDRVTTWSRGGETSRSTRNSLRRLQLLCEPCVVRKRKEIGL